jgi:hypothetical protein
MPDVNEVAGNQLLGANRLLCLALHPLYGQPPSKQGERALRPSHLYPALLTEPRVGYRFAPPPYGRR